ncbi:MAG TPA: hypothetical protein VMS96_12150 [Terriglobales bacterium]|nr:hypothetical protein [Terriglobales bacterium]
MKILAIVVAVLGWLLPILGLVLTASNPVRLTLCVLGIGLCSLAVLGMLNPAYVKHAIWKA